MSDPLTRNLDRSLHEDVRERRTGAKLVVLFMALTPTN